MMSRKLQAELVEQGRAAFWNDPSGARKIFEKAFEGGPSPEWAEAKLGHHDCEWGIGNEKIAVADLLDILAQPVEVVGSSARARAGVFLAGSQRLDADVQALRASTTACKEAGCLDEEAYGNRLLGDFARRAGDRAAAIAYYQLTIAHYEGVKRVSEASDLRVDVAAMMLDGGEPDAALAELRRAEERLAIDAVHHGGMGGGQRQSHALALEARANILIDQCIVAGRYDLAVAHAEHVVSLAHHGVSSGLRARVAKKRDAVIAMRDANVLDASQARRILAEPEYSVPPLLRLSAEKIILHDATDQARISVRSERAANAGRERNP